MTDQIILNADSRERTGTNKAREIRNIDGMVPAIVYGDEKETLNIKLKLNELTKASENELFYTQVLLIKTKDNEEKVVLKELQRDPAKGKFLHADFQRVSRKTKLKVIIPVNFINEEECVGIKIDGGVVAKAIREIEIMCLAGNIPESIDVDIENLNLGDSIRLTEISLPEGSEIPGLTEETDQMVVSVNAPKAVEEDPIIEDELEDGDISDSEEGAESAETDDAGSSEESDKEESSEENK
jgi:large subunit ribosomal protein L25